MKKDLRQYYPGLADACRRTYNLIIDAVRDAAKECGYALAVHGSLARDIDLVAIPWIEEARPAGELVEAIRQAAKQANRSHFAEIQQQDAGFAKPHGRRCWTIILMGGPYIDLSVMPLHKEDC